jgi:hypothetical protein
MSPPHDKAADGPDWIGDDGHLTDFALTAAADGQDVLSEGAEAHLATCEACTAQLVELAHASVEAREMLELAHPLALALPPRLPLPPLPLPLPLPPLGAPSPLASIPWRAVAAALCVSLVALSPALYHLPALLARVAPALLHGVPVLLRGVLFALASRGPSATLVTLMSSSLLILVGITVSRVFRHSGALS